MRQTGITKMRVRVPERRTEGGGSRMDPKSSLGRMQERDKRRNWCTVPWTARRFNQSTLKESNPEYSLEGLMLKLNLQYFGHLMWRTDSLEKTWCWERLKAEEKGTTEGEMIGWHHWLNGHEFEQTLGAGDGQRGLACCSPWSCKESNITERLNWTDCFWGFFFWLHCVPCGMILFSPYQGSNTVPSSESTMF